MASPTSITIAVLLLLHSTSGASNAQTKANSRPVVEIINEARSDTRTTKTPGILPYGNPLTGQNARLHAQNQQAMFNAERIRQHRAQLQRWTKAPLQMDSYMKAYHESQENHQMALEQQQAKEDQRLTTIMQDSATPAPKKRSRPENPRPKSIQPSKFTKADAISDKNRSQRSYGSNYQQYLANKRYLQNVFVSPAPAYDQGVTIKPHGNIGLSPLENKPNESTRLHTEIIPSKTQYVFPKQYSQMQDYKSAQDIQNLHSFLKQAPTDQLSHLTSLLQKEEDPQKLSEIETPIDLFFYTKDQPEQSLSQYYDGIKYAQIPASYHTTKDHTPITEDLDDIADPNQMNRIKNFVIPKPETKPLNEQLYNSENNIETTTIKSNNYYKVEVASQTISSGYKDTHDGHKHPDFISTHFKHPEYVTSQAKQHEYVASQSDLAEYLKNQQSHPEFTDSNSGNEVRIPEFTSLYYSHPTAYVRDPSESFVHHNAQHIGIQHLNEDGTGISAYGDDSVSSKTTVSNNKSHKVTRVKRANVELNTDAFIVPVGLNTNKEPTLIDKEKNETVKSEALRMRLLRFRKPFSPQNTFLSTPEFAVGEAVEINNDYNDRPEGNRQWNHRLNSYDRFEIYDDDDDYEDGVSDFSSPDADYNSGLQYQYKQPYQPLQTYAPKYQTNIDLQGSYSNRYKKFKRQPHITTSYGTPFKPTSTPNIDVQNSYGTPYHVGQNYDVPQSDTFQNNFAGVGVVPQSYFPHPQPTYGLPTFEHNSAHLPNLKEPIYMLSESQLKSLVGHHNLNIQHLDVFQVSKDKNRQRYYPRKYMNRPYHRRHKPRNLKKNLYKLNKLLN